ncbi:hypothetical protein KR50_04160 [Jeotgalibacillus campisalis]|uniref:Uncharacterized protein n=1 Tax=Jeotgalibacillus campisalis TaxID=220754 RepID=A0A0C2VW33_9BACL|nr:hypothetical protein KR50_04160 [Jeotgalibacillus campisalis]
MFDKPTPYIRILNKLRIVWIDELDHLSIFLEFRLNEYSA